ncbi:enoyl-CoA hydratase-related protein [Nocardia sp. NPDC052112]|uniref:enoyl-CoA hydratase/isomerase family protein n=1 Tax=Nocardia sp. NPDC052112 TaxID=3155646 RepID=UPI003448D964
MTSSPPHPETTTAPVLLDIDGATAHIVLNRPHCSNAIDMELARGFAAAVTEIGRSHQVGVVVLRAEGGNFCVGGDVTAMAAAPSTGQFITELASRMHAALLELSRLSIPVVAVVQGAAAGGGLGLVLAADLVVCTESARFVTAYSGVGLSPDCGVTYWLPRTVGVGHALQMLTTNRVVDAETAWEWGLVTHVVPSAELDDHMRMLITGLARGSAEALGQARRLVRASTTRSLAEHLDDEAATIARLADGADARGRITSFAAAR